MESTQKILNLPNILTILRIALSPVFFYFLLERQTYLAIIIFMFVAVTDFADGWVARKANLKTKFGEMIDPMADKFMVFFALAGLIIAYDFPVWSLPFILFRDIISLAGSLMVWIMSRSSWKASRLGKLTTFLQIVTILGYMINFEFKLYVLYLTILFSLAAGIEYLIKGTKILMMKHR